MLKFDCRIGGLLIGVVANLLLVVLFQIIASPWCWPYLDFNCMYSIIVFMLLHNSLEFSWPHFFCLEGQTLLQSLYAERRMLSVRQRGVKKISMWVHL